MRQGIRRRDFLKTLVAAGIIGSLGGVAKLLPYRRVVRPPGALVEEKFLSQCTRCGQCIQTCVTGTLVPCSLGEGLLIWGTPRVDPLRAPCEAVAGRCEISRPCVENCPTNALVYVEPEKVKMGSVKWIKENCIAYRGGECLVCYEVCPIDGAITPRRGIPVFHSGKCIGCGRCVYACPPEPKALYLVPDGERRIETTR